MMKWTETTQERFDEMLGCLPPEIMIGNPRGFLVGEPSDHVVCSVTKRIAPNFQAFVEINDKFYWSDRCITIAEFKLVTTANVLANVMVSA